MMSNNPVFRPRFIKRKFFEHFPDDPASGPAFALARAFQYGDRGIGCRWCCSSATVAGPTAIAAVRHACCFHFGILSSIPMGVPLEWNVFMMFSVLALFRRARLGRAGDPDHNRCRLLLFAVVAGHRRAGKPVPAQGVFPARHALPTRATGIPRCGASSRQPMRRSPRASSRSRGMPAAQLEKFYGSKEAAQIPMYMGYAFRAFNTHGRALFTAGTPRHGRPTRGTTTSLTDGERITSTAIGWNSAMGTSAMSSWSRLCRSAATSSLGEVRVVMLDAQPSTGRPSSTGWWTLPPANSSAATCGCPNMVTRQPWADDVPVHGSGDRAEGLDSRRA